MKEQTYSFEIHLSIMTESEHKHLHKLRWIFGHFLSSLFIHMIKTAKCKTPAITLKAAQLTSQTNHKLKNVLIMEVKCTKIIHQTISLISQKKGGYLTFFYFEMCDRKLFPDCGAWRRLCFHAADQHQPLVSAKSDRWASELVLSGCRVAVHSHTAVRSAPDSPSHPAWTPRRLDGGLGHASQNTWSRRLPGAEETASDWTANCRVFIFIRYL